MQAIRSNIVFLLLTLCVFLLGLAHIAVLPPFEGFDETAHYSSITEIADTGTIPILGRARMSREVEDYPGPRPYAPVPPFDDNGALTYRAFFAGSAPRIADAPSPPFQAGSLPNWQGQHPPLYYLAMAPISKVMADHPLKRRLLVLRVASLLLAVAALVVAGLANRRLVPMAGSLTLAWPLVMPNWFPEMARLGNDSLIALLVAIAWLAIVSISTGDDRRRWWLLAGGALGLAAMTKAFALPIGAGSLALLAFFAWRHRVWRWFAVTLVVVLVLATPWYGGLMVLGAPMVNDFSGLAAEGGVLQGLARNGSLSGFLHSVLAMIRSFLWAGTWSMNRPPLPFYGPMVIAWLVVLAGWAGVLRHRPLLAALPLVILGPMVASLAGHSVAVLALGLSGQTGGWYLHILAPQLALIAALSLPWLGRSRWRQGLAGALALYGMAFGAAMAWLQVSLFAGCAYREGWVKSVVVDGRCLFDGGLVIERLGILSYPALGLSAFIGGAAAGLAALAIGWGESRAAHGVPPRLKPAP